MVTCIKKSPCGVKPSQGVSVRQKNFRRTAIEIGLSDMCGEHVFSRRVSGGKILLPARIAPGKPLGFQQSAALFQLDENPQIFIESVKNPFLTRKITLRS